MPCLSTAQWIISRGIQDLPMSNENGGGCGEVLPRLGVENVGEVCVLRALVIVRRIAPFDTGMTLEVTTRKTDFEVKCSRHCSHHTTGFDLWCPRQLKCYS
jgi:hypothetical protein